MLLCCCQGDGSNAMAIDYSKLLLAVRCQTLMSAAFHSLYIPLAQAHARAVPRHRRRAVPGDAAGRPPGPGRARQVAAAGGGAHAGDPDRDRCAERPVKACALSVLSRYVRIPSPTSL